MLNIKFFIEEALKKGLAGSSNKKIGDYDIKSGHLIFECGEKNLNDTNIMPDTLLTWMSFLPYDEKSLGEAYSEDIWGTIYRMEWKDGHFSILENEKEIFGCEITAPEFINSLNEFVKNTISELISINPDFEHNEVIQEIKKYLPQ